jgi:hypothetical protein
VLSMLSNLPGIRMTMRLSMTDTLTKEPILRCLNHGPDCKGPVEYRYPRKGKAFPRCDHHWQKRLKLEEEIVRKYNPDGPGPPAGFDPADAGERWEDEY